MDPKKIKRTMEILEEMAMMAGKSDPKDVSRASEIKRLAEDAMIGVGESDDVMSRILSKERAPKKSKLESLNPKSPEEIALDLPIESFKPNWDDIYDMDKKHKMMQDRANSASRMMDRTEKKKKVKKLAEEKIPGSIQEAIADVEKAPEQMLDINPDANLDASIQDQLKSLSASDLEMLIKDEGITKDQADIMRQLSGHFSPTPNKVIRRPKKP